MHLVVNDSGELLNVRITSGNVDDRKPVGFLLQSLFGKVFADRGYISQSLTEQLHLDLGVEFFVKPRKNMRNYLMRLHDKLLSHYAKTLGHW
nr:transposase [Chroococcus sp. FPU101]